MCLLVIQLSALGKYPFKYFTHFLAESIAFYRNWSAGDLSTHGWPALCRSDRCCNYFLPGRALPVHFLEEKKYFNFMKPNLSMFSFVANLCCVPLKNMFPCPKATEIPSYVLSIVPPLIFRAKVHLDLLFMPGVRRGWRHITFQWLPSHFGSMF